MDLNSTFCLYTFTNTSDIDFVETCLPSSMITSVTQLNESLSSQLFTSLICTATDSNQLWVLKMANLVFWMQAGFTMLETGAVKAPNVQHILFKNLMDTCFSSVSWFLSGYAIAFGGSEDNGFLGINNFALTNFDNSDWHFWFFQFCFATTAATIVSGAVAERCTITAYASYTVLLVMWVYPVVAHWIWDDNGWLSAFNPDAPIAGGVLDFAGCGVVHMVGGWSGLTGAVFLGPRFGRFDKIKEQNIENRQSPHYTAYVERMNQQRLGNNVPLQVMGTLFLWMGWYGFNGGSTLQSVGVMQMASKIYVNTTLGAAAGGLSSVLIARKLDGYWSLPRLVNGVLIGLVSITACCNYIHTGDAIFLGLVAGAILLSVSTLIEKLKIDDPLDAFAVHGAGGVWGLLGAAMFARSKDLKEAGYNDDLVKATFGHLLGVQLLAMVCIIAWVLVHVVTLFYILHKLGELRVSLLIEEAGLDWAEHGAEAVARAPDRDLDPIAEEVLYRKSLKARQSQLELEQQYSGNSANSDEGDPPNAAQDETQGMNTKEQYPRQSIQLHGMDQMDSDAVDGDVMGSIEPVRSDSVM